MRNIHTRRSQHGPGRLLLLAVLLGAPASLVACGDCTDEIEAARVFLDKPANLACESGDDCVVVSTGCHTFSKGVCAQAQLGRQAAASAEWSQLSEDLNDCEDSCSQCLVGLSPSCTEGMCGGPP